MKSIRQEILIALNKYGEQTVDDLLDRVSGSITRKQIGDNIAQTVVEKLTIRRKDVATNMPAYKITDLGVQRIKSDGAVKPHREVKAKSTEVKARPPDSEQTEEDDTIAALHARINSAESSLRAVTEQRDRLIAEKAQPALCAPAGESQQVTVEQFLVRAPKCKPVIVNSLDKARQVSISSARRFGIAKVYALVPVGNATNSAVWSQA